VRASGDHLGNPSSQAVSCQNNLVHVSALLTRVDGLTKGVMIIQKGARLGYQLLGYRTQR
jgi:hypothetical protein